jgi:hypothetical protein
MSQMERKILMSRESENIVSQWEEQKRMGKEKTSLEQILIKMIKAPAPKKKAPKKKK